MAERSDDAEYASELFRKGVVVRREVLGAEHVERSLANADAFSRAFQKITTEVAWGQIWTRPGLSRKQRSILTLGMVAALGRTNELRLHIRGALTNGVTRDEIKEVFLQACIYCGFPAGLDACAVAREVFAEIDAAHQPRR